MGFKILYLDIDRESSSRSWPTFGSRVVDSVCETRLSIYGELIDICAHRSLSAVRIGHGIPVIKSEIDCIIFWISEEMSIALPVSNFKWVYFIVT